MRVLAAAVLVAVTATAANAAKPTPSPTAPPRINVLQVQPKALAPTKPLHVELIVEINRLGQVSRVRSITASHNYSFDAQCYGNSLQAFIRTPDGHVVVGTYRLVYDYDPKSMLVKRDVALIKAGGVNPNAEGAAMNMMEIARRSHTKGTPAVTPGPIPSVNIKRMPDLPQVMKTPSH
ncbi:MAG TPA: hypothetical protein VHT05_07090 [Candidatus Elarobacter sp.]|jgi:hypothetical protein|nr:hypothetical protein [Candidatus Elarobacter sp.]